MPRIRQLQPGETVAIGGATITRQGDRDPNDPMVVVPIKPGHGVKMRRSEVAGYCERHGIPIPEGLDSE